VTGTAHDAAPARTDAHGPAGAGARPGTLMVEVVSPEAVLYHGVARAVVAPLFDGQAGILSRHAPMLALLGRGLLKISAPDGDRRFTLAGGFIQVSGNVVRVVAEQAAAA